MQQVLAITKLTLKAALRFRLVQVLGTLLLIGVVALPAVIEHDGTARGFIQIILTYTLSLIGVLLGFATLWLSCGLLAREIEDAQMQMLDVKPVARWQVWVGKWLGIVALNAGLLLVSGAVVYALMMYRANKLPADEQRVLAEEIFVARGAAREPIPDYKADARLVLQQNFASGPPAGVEPQQLEAFIEARVKAQYEAVEPLHIREWTLDLGDAADLRDAPIYLRVKYNAAVPSGTENYLLWWEAGPPERIMNLLTETTFRNDPYGYVPGHYYRTNLMMAYEGFTEFKLAPNLFNDQGVIKVRFYNYTSSPMSFPLEDGLEVLVRRGGFGLNYARGLGILLFWLSLLAAIGLTASTFLAFPVAAFCSICLLIISFSTGTLEQIIEEGGITQINANTGYADEGSILNKIAVPAARGTLAFLQLARGFAPIDNLSSGRVISWNEFAMALVKIVVLMGGMFALLGILIFNKRELATAQTGH